MKFRSAFLAAALALPLQAAVLSRGDTVRLTRGETLTLNGKKLHGAAKGQEFTVLKTDPGNVFIAYMKEDGALVAATLPAEAVEPAPVDGWRDIAGALDAFRNQSWDEARRLAARAITDPKQKDFATAVSGRINGLLTSASAAKANPTQAPLFNQHAAAARDFAAALAAKGHHTLAFTLDDGADKLAALAGVANAPATKLDRAATGQKAAAVTRALMRGRQALGQRRLMEAGSLISAGLTAEPTRPELVAMHAQIQKDIEEANYLYKTADSMRTKGDKGVVHALSALEDGLKLCADHVQLRELRTAMAAQLEARTSPQVTQEFMAKAKSQTAKEALIAGRELYVERCAECHDLERLSSKSYAGWERAVAGMARRAGFDNGEQRQVMDYIAAAMNVVGDE